MFVTHLSQQKGTEQRGKGACLLKATWTAFWIERLCWSRTSKGRLASEWGIQVSTEGVPRRGTIVAEVWGQDRSPLYRKDQRKHAKYPLELSAW